MDSRINPSRTRPLSSFTNDCYRAPLCSASRNGHFEILEILIVDPRINSLDKNIALEVASQHGHLSIVNRLLMDPDVDPSSPTASCIPRKALNCACGNGYLEIVNRLLEDPRVNPFIDQNYALHCAFKNGHQSVIKRLLKDPRIDPTVISY
jgi:ankyrin repeat protein